MRWFRELLWAVWTAGLVASLKGWLPEGALGGGILILAVAAGGWSIWLRMQRRRGARPRDDTPLLTRIRRLGWGWRLGVAAAAFVVVGMRAQALGAEPPAPVWWGVGGTIVTPLAFLLLDRAGRTTGAA